MMSPVYVKEQGAVVRRQGERLIVTRGEEKLLDLPLVHLEQLNVFGNVQVTTQAVAMLLAADKDVVFFSVHGKYRGRLNSGSKHAGLRVAQLRKMSDEQIGLDIARRVVMGKLHNQQFLLEAQGHETQMSARHHIRQAAGAVNRGFQQARQAKAVDSLRGYEGSAGAAYWSAYRVLLARDYGFQGRNYFPPPDPVNALLSFGYSLLLKDVTAAVHLVGLDPYLGFFHVIDYGRPSLALDMMEEFRPVAVDGLVLNLINSGTFSPASFEQTTNPKRPIQLTDRAADLLIEAYERKLAERAEHPMAGGQTSLRRVIEMQVRRLARVMMDQARDYEPFLLK